MQRRKLLTGRSDLARITGVDHWLEARFVDLAPNWLTALTTRY